MAEKLTPTALVLLDAPNEVILHRRPNLPGKLAYPDQGHFFGGHLEEGETAGSAAARELGEESSLTVSPGDLELYWQGPYVGQDKYNRPAPRYVTLFRLGLTAAEASGIELAESEGGVLLPIAKNQRAFEAAGPILTPFAHVRLAEFAIQQGLS